MPNFISLAVLKFKLAVQNTALTADNNHVSTSKHS